MRNVAPALRNHMWCRKRLKDELMVISTRCEVKDNSSTKDIIEIHSEFVAEGCVTTYGYCADANVDVDVKGDGGFFRFNCDRTCADCGVLGCNDVYT